VTIRLSPGDPCFVCSLFDFYFDFYFVWSCPSCALTGGATKAKPSIKVAPANKLLILLLIILILLIVRVVGWNEVHR